jgi:hypothetical protein
VDGQTSGIDRKCELLQPPQPPQSTTTVTTRDEHVIKLLMNKAQLQQACGEGSLIKSFVVKQSVKLYVKVTNADGALETINIAINVEGKEEGSPTFAAPTFPDLLLAHLEEAGVEQYKDEKCTPVPKNGVAPICDLTAHVFPVSEACQVQPASTELDTCKTGLDTCATKCLLVPGPEGSCERTEGSGKCVYVPQKDHVAGACSAKKCFATSLDQSGRLAADFNADQVLCAQENDEVGCVAALTTKAGDTKACTWDAAGDAKGTCEYTDGTEALTAELLAFLKKDDILHAAATSEHTHAKSADMTEVCMATGSTQKCVLTISDDTAGGSCDPPVDGANGCVYMYTDFTASQRRRRLGASLDDRTTPATAEVQATIETKATVGVGESAGAVAEKMQSASAEGLVQNAGEILGLTPEQITAAKANSVMTAGPTEVEDTGLKFDPQLTFYVPLDKEAVGKNAKCVAVVAGNENDCDAAQETCEPRNTQAKDACAAIQDVSECTHTSPAGIELCEASEQDGETVCRSKDQVKCSAAVADAAKCNAATSAISSAVLACTYTGKEAACTAITVTDQTESCTAAPGPSKRMPTCALTPEVDGPSTKSTLWYTGGIRTPGSCVLQPNVKGLAYALDGSCTYATHENVDAVPVCAYRSAADVLAVKALDQFAAELKTTPDRLSLWQDASLGTEGTTLLLPVSVEGSGTKGTAANPWTAPKWATGPAPAWEGTRFQDAWSSPDSSCGTADPTSNPAKPLPTGAASLSACAKACYASKEATCGLAKGKCKYAEVTEGCLVRQGGAVEEKAHPTQCQVTQQQVVAVPDSCTLAGAATCGAPEDGTEIDATALVAGTYYTITTPGTTDWTEHGASNGDVDTVSRATGPALGGGGMAKARICNAAANNAEAGSCTYHPPVTAKPTLCGKTDTASPGNCIPVEPTPEQYIPVTDPKDNNGGDYRGSADKGVKGVFDPLRIILPPSIRF